MDLTNINICDLRFDSETYRFNYALWKPRIVSNVGKCQNHRNLNISLRFQTKPTQRGEIDILFIKIFTQTTCFHPN